MINSKQWNVKQIIIGLLICMMASAVLITTLSAQENDEPAGYAWEVRVEAQNGEVVSLRDIWLVDADGEMIDGSLATYQNECEIGSPANGDASVDGDVIHLARGVVSCANRGLDAAEYNVGMSIHQDNRPICENSDNPACRDTVSNRVFPSDWQGIRALWGVRICRYTSCDFSSRVVHKLTVEASVVPDPDKDAGGLLYFGPANADDFAVAVGRDEDGDHSAGWLLSSTRNGNDPVASVKLDNPANQIYFTTTCPSDPDPNDALPCQLEYTVDGQSGVLKEGMPTQYPQYFEYSGGYRLGTERRISNWFHGEVEYVTIKGITCEACFD